MGGDIPSQITYSILLINQEFDRGWAGLLTSKPSPSSIKWKASVKENPSSSTLFYLMSNIP
jgi:hypothetical protein